MFWLPHDRGSGIRDSVSVMTLVYQFDCTYIQNIAPHSVLSAFAQILILPLGSTENFPVADDSFHPFFNLEVIGTGSWEFDLSKKIVLTNRFYATEFTG